MDFPQKSKKIWSTQLEIFSNPIQVCIDNCGLYNLLRDISQKLPKIEKP